MQVSTPKEEKSEFKFPKSILSNWPNNKDDYELREIIGYGATAVVYAAWCTSRKEECAIKRINLEKCNTSMDELLKEIQVMSMCNHENVVTYYTSFVVKEELWLILGLLRGGSLLDVIKYRIKTQNCTNGVFDETVIATVLKEVLKALEYFHSNGQIHRDIKAGNILLGEDGTIQIADFGVSAWLATRGDMSREKSRHTFVGTPCWMAPEVMAQEKGYDFKADIWSFGITAIELATGTAPYHSCPPMKVLMLTLQNDPPTLDTGAVEKDQYKNYGKTFRKLIADCLQKDPTKRPTATELLKHHFFKKSKNKKELKDYFESIGVPLDKGYHKSKHPRKHGPNSGKGRNSETGDWTWDSEEERERKSEDKNLCLDVVTSMTIDDDESNPVIPVPDSNYVIAADEETLSDNQNASKMVNFVLRMRNARRELNDIRFEFMPGEDSAEGIASELVTANLIDGRDVEVVAYNLKKLIESQQTQYSVFALVSGCGLNEVPDEKALVGFAQLTIV